MLDSLSKDSSSLPKPLDNPIAHLNRAIDDHEEYIIATGAHARQMSADLEEVRRLRQERTGGSVFKRARSRYWQIKYRGW
jgi:hypothetical protein